MPAPLSPNLTSVCPGFLSPCPEFALFRVRCLSGFSQVLVFPVLFQTVSVYRFYFLYFVHMWK